MKFGSAIECARCGMKVAREGWNGKNMYVYMTKGRTSPTDVWEARMPSQELTEVEIERGDVIINTHLDMMSAQGVRIIGWLASQTDMLADDWYVVEDKCTPEDE